VLIGGHDEPEEVDLTDAPGVGSEDIEN